jgi:hypothetical protein
MRTTLPSIRIFKEQPMCDFVAEETPINPARAIDCWSLGVVRVLVEPIGIEPMTSCLQSRRSPS